MPNDNYANEPNQSRSEDIIQSIIDGTEYDEEARSRIEYLLKELKATIEGGGGGGGFTPTETQLTAMNSGIDSAKVAQIATNENNILSTCCVGTCTTVGNVAAKVVTISDNSWTPHKGSIIAVKFSYSNDVVDTESTPITLNVNNTGAYRIWYKNGAYVNARQGKIFGYAGYYIYYMFDGVDRWLWINYSMDNTYTNMSQSEASAGTSTNERLITAKVLSDTIDEKILSKANTSDVNTATTSLQAQIDQIVISASAESVVAPEVAQARVSEDGTEYDTLKDRLDTQDNYTKEELTELKLELEGGSEKPVGEPGTKSIISTDNIWFQYAEVIPRITRIKYTAVEGTTNFYRITYVEDALTLEYEPIISVENTADETGTIKTVDVDFTLSENQYVGINGAFRFKLSDVYYSRNYNLATGKISKKQGQYLDFIAEYAGSISAKVNNLENELGELNVRTDALEDAINNPTVDKTLRRHGEVVLYEHSFKSSDSEFVGTQVFDNYGIVVTDRVYLERSYAVSDRTVKYVCKFTATSSALFEVVTENGTTVNTRIIVDVPDKTVTLYGKTAETCSFLNDTDEFMVSITKNYQDLRINVTDIYTGEELNLEYTMSGTGGAGAGAIEVDKYNSVPMQHCYYAVSCRNSSSFSISKMIIVSAKCDLLIYGDSITEGEAYWPHDLFNNHWVQKLVKNTDCKALSSGRSGGNFDDIYSRMQNEIPYIKPKYVMITTGTNGSASVENYTTLVQYVKSQSCIPILNHIPCYDNNGDATSFIRRNANIDEVRASENVRGADFDLATSTAHDGQNVDTSTMWYEDYSSTTGKHYYHHPNVKGCAAMFQRILIDVPEIFNV